MAIATTLASDQPVRRRRERRPAGLSINEFVALLKETGCAVHRNDLGNKYKATHASRPGAVLSVWLHCHLNAGDIHNYRRMFRKLFGFDPCF